MSFSVIIPTYNRLHLLKRTLDSVRRQRFADFEVIVVDDGSDDGTQAFVRSLGGNVRLVQQPNAGPGAARNAGIREARGEYVALLDSDDVWFPWTLEVFADAIERFGRPCIVGGQLVEFTDEMELVSVREEPRRSASFADYVASSRYPYHVGSGTCVLRREALAGVNFLEDRLNAEDHDLVLQLGVRPGFVRILSPTTLAWRRHPVSETGKRASTASGMLRLLAREGSGAYPGGMRRARERRRILARHVRPAALACLREGDPEAAWRLYGATLRWHLELGSWKFALGFPVLALLEWARRQWFGLSKSDHRCGSVHGSRADRPT
jgi:glycosyltransferase involved in cell wall biosynthesis